MRELECDVAVIGAGPAGLAAAAAAKKNGAEKVVIIERDSSPGGILQQCIHPGFGLNYFHEELTGPEYAGRFIAEAEKAGVKVLFNTMALDLREEELMCSGPGGLLRVRSGAVVLAMGCRERTRANLVIPGSRPAGIYTAGTAQRLINIQGHMVGKKVVILGSGDIGMIMARRMTLEGAEVKAVVEIMPYLAGLRRNKVQCLDDFNIPLLLSHTVTDITGVDRVEKVTIAPVDGNKDPICEESREIQCDTLLLSVGLIPENELSRGRGVPLSSVTKGASVNQYMQTEIPNVFACGNVLHVNDLVDNVSRESERAGRNAARYAAGVLPVGRPVSAVPGENVRYVCPQRVIPGGDEEIRLFFRVAAPGEEVTVSARSGDRVLVSRKAPFVNPGEMESLTISAEDAVGLTADITVEVKGGAR
ncbi:NAD(P)/FAD-dependent oxidoreductase [Bacilliculturomica massiliensis]|uniref:NAD(P)/FAD-dependent oxidoreductase n=1 Tax=Bacilliculturomica massiliensis TaxID=1917867 RepID=UPI0010323FAB|nr:FAD-dependent oxidoreductase [Bacilliculturomica massiliensis]